MMLFGKDCLVPCRSQKSALASLVGLKPILVLVFVALVAWVGMAPSAWCQCSWEQLYTFTGYTAEDLFGRPLSGAGDVNNDGYDDLIVGAEGNDIGGSNAGQAHVYSGHTEILYWIGEAAGDNFGYSVSAAGDVNNDGHDDLIVGAPLNDAGGYEAGRAYVYSGLTTALLYTFTAEAAQDHLGHSVSGAGDVNNDGYEDVIVGAPYNDGAGDAAGRAYVYSGLTGGLLWTFNGESAGDALGWSVSGAGDVNNDGYADLIAGAPFNDAGGTNVGEAYVYSGLTGGLLWTFTGGASDDLFGWSVSGAGDVNNDGYDDLIVGAPYSDVVGDDWCGRGYVYSGLTGGLLYTFTGETRKMLGWSVSGAGDVNNDGYDDVIAGAVYGGDISAGQAYVYSGETGDLLWTFEGEAYLDFFGWSVSEAGDVNNDGYDDLIVGADGNDAGSNAAGRAYVYGGRSGALLCTYTGEAAEDRFGYSVSGAGDVNNDGFNEVIVGAPENDAGGSDAGKAYVYSCQVNDPAPQVLSTSPTQNELNVPINSSISVTFDVDMGETSINESTFVVNAWSTGLHTGIISYNNQTYTATLDPSENFDEGEIVTVVLTTDIQSSLGVPLESSYIWSFTTDVSDQSSGTFGPAVNYEAGDGPYSVFCADLDGDTDLDLAVAGYESDSIFILMNNGNGTFQPKVGYRAGNGPSSVFCSDLDGDSDLDLAVANYLSNYVSILMNNGNGTFQDKVDYNIGAQSISIFCADLDGDLGPDLAVTAYWTDSVSILKNQGDGTFQPKINYGVGTRPEKVFCADLDGDADLDLAVSNIDDDSVSILKNNGNGTFEPKVDYAVGDCPRQLFCSDLDGDSDLDLAVPNFYDDNVSILKNFGDGTFEPKVDYVCGTYPQSAFCADLDGDLDLDLAILNWTANVTDKVSILKNNGDGTFQAKVDYDIGDGPLSVFCADLDGDSDLDLASANLISDNVSILFNCLPTGDCNGDEGINSADVSYLINYLFINGPAPNPLRVGDVNRDGLVNSADVSYLINYLFVNGPAPSCL